MYNSPITIIESTIDSLSKTIIKQKDDAIFAEIQSSFGVDVDKEELLRALHYDRQQYDKGYADGKRDAQKWIPVTERLPEDEELVLIHCKNGAMFVGYCGKQYCDYERRWRIKTALNSTKLLNLGRVTHWMPLPEPPKEGAEDG